MWLVCGEQPEALGLKEMASVATLQGVCARVHVCLSGTELFNPLNATCPTRSPCTKGFTVLFSRDRITSDFFSLLAYLKFLPSTWTFFME